MMHEASMLAGTQGHRNTAFCQADAEALPFRHGVCDLVTSKLAFHYFPHPQVALAEMARVATPAARVVLIDRVSPEDPDQRAYQNRLEKLRTPSKTYVYSASQLVAALAEVGLIVETQARYAEQMAVDVWLLAAGVDEPTAHTILTLLTADGDPAGLQVRHHGDQLLMTHQTVVLWSPAGRRREAVIHMGIQECHSGIDGWTMAAKTHVVTSRPCGTAGLPKRRQPSGCER
jgi:SAM-dependent methyltransferase